VDVDSLISASKSAVQHPVSADVRALIMGTVDVRDPQPAGSLVGEDTDETPEHLPGRAE